MFQQNILYVTNCYDEDKFKQMLSNHSNHRKGAKLSEGLIIQCIAALLYCREHNKLSKEITKMEALLANTGIHFADVRSSKPKVSKSEASTYIGKPETLTGNPECAIQVFNELMSICYNPA